MEFKNNFKLKNGGGRDGNEGHLAKIKEPRLGFVIHARILKYLDLAVIWAKLIPLSSSYKQFVYSENYTLAKKWLRLFCLNKEILRGCFLAKTDIGQVITRSCLAAANCSWSED